MAKNKKGIVKVRGVAMKFATKLEETGSKNTLAMCASAMIGRGTNGRQVPKEKSLDELDECNNDALEE